MIEFDTTQYESISVLDDVRTSSEERGYTYLHCTFYTSPKYTWGWWVNIFLTSYLVDKLSTDRLELIDAINIPISPDKHYLKHKGDCLNFTLVFPHIPKNWIMFDFIEIVKYGAEGMRINNIARNNSGVYKVVIS